MGIGGARGELRSAGGTLQGRHFRLNILRFHDAYIMAARVLKAGIEMLGCTYY